MKHSILEDNCYVLHSDFYHPILKSKYDGILLWPEKGQSLLSLKSGLKFKNSIITKCAELISCYSRENVWI